MVLDRHPDSDNEISLSLSVNTDTLVNRRRDFRELYRLAARVREDFVATLTPSHFSHRSTDLCDLSTGVSTLRSMQPPALKNDRRRVTYVLLHAPGRRLNAQLTMDKNSSMTGDDTENCRSITMLHEHSGCGFHHCPVAVSGFLHHF